MNSYRNKFELLNEKVNGIIDVLVISETKIDYKFPTANFVVDSFNAECRSARGTKGEGIMLFC